MTQAEVASKADIGKPFFSAVVNGTGVLSEEELVKCCEILDCDPSRLYSPDILTAIYGIDSRKQVQERVSVKLSGEDLAPFYELKELLGTETNADAVRMAIKIALEFRQYWN